MKVVVTGAGGFIGGHLARTLRQSGHQVSAFDIREAEFPHDTEPAVELLDLRKRVSPQLFEDADVVYALAADMGGMGRISHDTARLMRNNALIDINTFEAARKAGVGRIVYTSTACVYPYSLQVAAEAIPLRETDAFPADPRDPYGFEKLFGEQLLEEYARDFHVSAGIARLHNVYGPHGTFDGGREKVPAALCRKVALIDDRGTIEVWGDGKQTRTFCYIDDCVDALLRLGASTYSGPVNIGSEELVSIDELAGVVARVAGKPNIRIVHVDGPQGVRGRSSDSTLAESELGWAPSTPLESGIAATYDWIAGRLAHHSQSIATS